MEKFQFLIPNESNETMIEEVRCLRKKEENLRNLWVNYQYQEILMSSFEYIELYKNVISNLEEEGLFQFINREGKRITLRWDFTIPIARYYISKKTNEVARYCYFGKVYRKEKALKCKNSENYQAGIELINEEKEQGETECLALLEDSLSVLRLQDFRIEFGSALFFKRVCELTGKKEELTHILEKKNESEMEKWIKQNSFSEDLNKLLRKLLRMNGTEEILERLLTEIKDEILREEILKLEAVKKKIKKQSKIIFDLAMVPKMEYYDGLMFQVYSKYAPNPIASGGRYDRLYQKFGKEVSAIGIGFYQNEILQVLKKEGEENA